MTERARNYLIGLLHELRGLPKETEWVEFKVNFTNLQNIGEYISALSNSAVLNGKANTYLLWGIDNENHDIVGTAFKPEITKKGNEELENWLLRLLNPRIHFRFYQFEADDLPVVILEVARASSKPVQF